MWKSRHFSRGEIARSACQKGAVLRVFGRPADLKETIDHLVEASTQPLSVVIVGVGQEDWREMEKLDGNEIPLASSSGVKMSRDIVTFVPFNQFKDLPREKVCGGWCSFSSLRIIVGLHSVLFLGLAPPFTLASISWGHAARGANTSRNPKSISLLFRLQRHPTQPGPFLGGL